MALTRIGLMAKRHWSEHRPRMVKELKSIGSWQWALEEAQGQMKKALVYLTMKGIPYASAWDLVTRQWLYLPPESEARKLPHDRAPWLTSLDQTTQSRLLNNAAENVTLTDSPTFESLSE